MGYISLVREMVCKTIGVRFDSGVSLVRKKIRDNSPYSTWRMCKAIFWSLAIGAAAAWGIILIVAKTVRH